MGRVNAITDRRREDDEAAGRKAERRKGREKRK